MSEPEQPLGSERPQCVAIVVCSEVMEDIQTRNKSLWGLFNAIGVTALPAQQPKIAILVSLTDCRGEWPINLKIRTPSGNVLFQVGGAVRSDNPLVVHDMVVNILNLPLPELGEYSVELFAGGQFLASRHFTVIQRSPQ